MALWNNINVAALQASGDVSTTEADLGDSDKVFSGSHITRAADAAGLALSARIPSQFSRVATGIRNAEEGAPLAQTVEAALNETQCILRRMRDLSVRAANIGRHEAHARRNIQFEINQLKHELTRVADTADLDRSALPVGKHDGTSQVGANVKVRLSQGTSAADLGLAGLDVTLDATGITCATYAAATITTRSTQTNANDSTEAQPLVALNGSVGYRGRTMDLATIGFGAGASTTARLRVINDALAAAGVRATATVDSTGSVVFTGAEFADSTSPADIAAVAVRFERATGADAGIVVIDAAIKKVSRSAWLANQIDRINAGRA